jgi:hypothetical protein
MPNMSQEERDAITGKLHREKKDNAEEIRLLRSKLDTACQAMRNTLQKCETMVLSDHAKDLEADIAIHIARQMFDVEELSTTIKDLAHARNVRDRIARDLDE